MTGVALFASGVSPSPASAETASDTCAVHEIQWEVPLDAGYSLSGGIAALRADGTPSNESDVAQEVRKHLEQAIDRKSHALDNAGVSGSVTQGDIAAMRDALTQARPYQLKESEERQGSWLDGQCVEGVTSGTSTPTPQVPTSVAASFNCPFLPNDLFAVCTKERDPNEWAWDHGQWNLLSFAAHPNYTLWMDTNWSSDSHLDLLRNSSPNDNGVEVNTALTEKISSAVTSWSSDLPGSYRETITLDDDVTTFGIGSDRAGEIISGRWYYSDIQFTSGLDLSDHPMDYYGQVDLDMIANGDAGFYADDSCCQRNGRTGGNFYEW